MPSTSCLGVVMDDVAVEPLLLGAQKVLRNFRCTPSAARVLSQKNSRICVADAKIVDVFVVNFSLFYNQGISAAPPPQHVS